MKNRGLKKIRILLFWVCVASRESVRTLSDGKARTPFTVRQRFEKSKPLTSQF